MASSTIPVLLPDSTVRAAEVQARLRGVPLEDWVARAVTERLDTTEGAQEFFRRRAQGAMSREAAIEFIRSARDAPPMPGDELPEGWVPPGQSLAGK